MDPARPASSPLLVKTAKGANHGGGTFWSGQDADFQALLRWVAEGAQDN